jgi:hypothetical protein
MNKIIIVGHLDSSYKKVESLLLECGMRAPLPSRRDNMLPEEIGAALQKAHGIPFAESILNESEFEQIKPGSVWNGLALDLLLGNIEQEFWGWADSQAVFLLEYWHSLDPQIAFLLVYDEPQKSLEGLTAEHIEDWNEELVTGRLENWAAYNGALLHFHLKHPGRCLLVNSRQACKAAEQCLSQLRKRLSAPLHLPKSNETLSIASQPAAAYAEIAKSLDGAMAITRQSHPEAISSFLATPTEQFLINEYLTNHPAYEQLYQELQAASNLPVEEDQRPSQSGASAWAALVRQRQFASDLINQLKEHFQHLKKQSEDSLLQTRTLLEDTKEENKLLLNQLSTMREKLEKENTQTKLLQDSLLHTRTSLEDTKEENKLLLNQLFVVQEHLEKQYTQNHKQSNELEFQINMLEHFDKSLRVVRSKHKFWWIIMPKAWLNRAVRKRVRKRIKYLKTNQS